MDGNFLSTTPTITKIFYVILHFLSPDVLHVNSASHFLQFYMQVMFPMFQELAPHDPHDKCGHHYAICLDLKNQHFEVLDSMRSADDA